MSVQIFRKVRCGHLTDTIEADWTLGGTLKLPWRPRIKTVQGHTVRHREMCLMHVVEVARNY